MMLASIRARGLRGLIDLPKLILLGLYLRRIGKEFAALIASLDAGTLLSPAPWTAPPDRQAAPAQPAGPYSADRARQLPPGHPAVPAIAAADRARPAPAARPVPAAPKTPLRRTRAPQALRHQAFARPHRTPDPLDIVGLPAGLLDTGRTW
jgi:hypothetical protein